MSKPEAGEIRIAADAKIPTVVMQMFGFSTLPVAVSCDASLNFVNTDIVLVLDVTGSMAESISGSTKIAALQDAVLALYDELAPTQAQLQAQAQGQARYQGQARMRTWVRVRVRVRERVLMSCT